MSYKYLIGSMGGELPRGRKFETLVGIIRADEHKLLDEISVKPYVESIDLMVQKLNENHPRTKPWSVRFSERDFGQYHYVEIHCEGYMGCYVTLTVINGDWMPF